MFSAKLAARGRYPQEVQYSIRTPTPFVFITALPPSLAAGAATGGTRRICSSLFARRVPLLAAGRRTA